MVTDEQVRRLLKMRTYNIFRTFEIGIKRVLSLVDGR